VKREAEKIGVGKMSGQVKALVSADQPLILIYGGDGE
jgi:hypothetical protein